MPYQQDIGAVPISINFQETGSYIDPYAIRIGVLPGNFYYSLLNIGIKKRIIFWMILTRRINPLD